MSINCCTFGKQIIFQAVLYAAVTPCLTTLSFSCLKIQTNVVVTINNKPQHNKKSDIFIMPVCCGVDLRYLLARSGDVNARKQIFPKKYPAVWPTELHVEAYATFLVDSIVSAQPSVAISCVAARKHNEKNKAVSL